VVEQEIMNDNELKKTLADHALWLSGDSAGIRADLRGADLRGADLIRADLCEADLRGAIGYISGPQRTDGYQFAAVYMGNIFAWKVVAGCRHMCIENYRKHIESYNDPAKAAETAAILDFLEARINQLGHPK
jgi:hypothetical protein